VDYNPYTPIWNKYRPVILKLMTAAENEPQQYKLFGHEFKAMGQKVKSGYNFSLEASKGKAVNSIKGSIIAHDLLQILQQSNKAMELMKDATYEFSMDKNFLFKVSRKVAAVATDKEQATTEKA
jgi:hypothetical protein